MDISATFGEESIRVLPRLTTEEQKVFDLHIHVLISSIVGIDQGYRDIPIQTQCNLRGSSIVRLFDLIRVVVAYQIDKNSSSSIHC